MNDLSFAIQVRRFGFVWALLCALVFSLASYGQEQESSAKAQLPAAQNSGATPKPFHEDLGKLTLEGSTMRIEPAQVGGTYDAPGNGFIREWYELNWRVNDPLDLYIIRPRGSPKAPVILYLYSFPDDSDVFKNNAWCESAVRGGYAAVGFVSALTGHRLRYRPGKDSFISEMQEGLAASTHDVQLILNFLATRDYLDVSRVGMFGVGSGGSIAILASATDARISAVDVLGPWGDWPEWFAESKVVLDNERADFTKPEFLAKVAPLDPVLWLPKSKAKHMRIQDVRINKSMPDKCQEKLEAAAPDFAIVNQYGNGRSFFNFQPQSMLFEWVKDQLKTGVQADAARAKSERFHVFPAMAAPEQSKAPVASSQKGQSNQ